MKTAHYANKLKRMEEKETVAKLSRFLSGYFGVYFQNSTVSVLDIGCGIGHYMKALKTLGIKDVTGLEIDKTCVGVCRKDGLSIIQGDILRPSRKLLNKKYDVVIAFDVIEHVPVEKTKLFIHNALKLVKKGGKLLIRTPSMNNPFSASIRYIDMTHTNGFTEESLCQLMDEAHVEEYTIRHLDIFVIHDTNIVRLLFKFFAKVFLRVTEFFFQLYYYCFNSKWKNMRLDILLVIQK